MPTDDETTNLLRTLAERRAFLRSAAEGLTEDQARLTPTVSTLSVGGLIKHVSHVEAGWIKFILQGDSDPIDWDAVQRGEQSRQLVAWEAAFHLRDDETLAEVLQAYADVATETERIIGGLESLDITHPLAPAP